MICLQIQLKQFRPFEDDGSAICRVPTQVRKVLKSLERDVHDFRALGGREVAGKCEMKYIQLQVNQTCFCRNPESLHTLNFSFLLLKTKQKKRLPGHSSNTDAHFRSPVNGLESSALLLQFNTVLMYIYIFTSSTLILFKITRVIISNHRRTNNKR